MESFADGSSLSPKTQKSSGIVLTRNPISTPKAARPSRPPSPREVKNDVSSPATNLHSAMKPVYDKNVSPPNEKQSHRSPSEGEIARKWDQLENGKIKSVEEMIADTLSVGACEQASRQLSRQGTSVSQPKFCPSPPNSMYSATVYAEAKQSFTNTEVSEYVSSINKSGEIGEASDSCDFMESWKPSTYRGRTGSDLSDESRSSRCSSTIYKPHKANDTRWEAIQAVRSRYRMLGLVHFRLLRKLGCGDIGSVYLSELKGTGSYFATKIMDKEALAGRKKLLRAQTEREILQSLDHPFLPTLYAHFETEKFSCLVMELCPGGDLHALRQRQPGKYFPEHAARFYAAEVLLAFEYLHMLGIIYRDLKPENVLVREDGHIMLSDFDLSFRCAVSPTLVKSSNPAPYLKNLTFCVQPACIEPTCVIQPKCFAPRMLSSKCKREKKLRRMKSDTFHQVRLLPELIAEPTNARSMSFVGTHEYLAPEIIKGEGHGSAVDWWTFGIFLFELLFGKTPFVGMGNRATLINVVGQPLRFPETPAVSFAARDLIRGLLVKEPQHRLAYRRGATEVKQHPFFQGVNWALIRCTNPPDVPWPVIIDTPVKPSDSPSPPPPEMTPPSAAEVEMKSSGMGFTFEIDVPTMLIVAAFLCRIVEGTIDTLLVSYTCSRTYPLYRNYPMALHFALPKVITTVLPLGTSQFMPTGALQLSDLKLELSWLHERCRDRDSPYLFNTVKTEDLELGLGELLLRNLQSPGFCMDFNEREEKNQDGPNIFGYYCRGVALLLAGSDDFSVDVIDNRSKEEIDKPTTKVELEGARTSTNSKSLFSDRYPAISNFQKENLESFLTQATLDLSTEFEQVRQSVLKLHNLMTILRSNNQGATHSDPDGRCHKKIKMTPSSVSDPRSPVIATSGESSSNIGLAKSQGAEHLLVSSDDTDHRSRDEDAALQLLLENNGPMVELLLNKYLDEQYANLAYMVSQIDELLDELFSRWRPMTRLEKQHLQKLIKDLPEHHLSDVAELLTCARRPEAECDEIFVNLDKEENQTLWRIYYYISKKLSSR